MTYQRIYLEITDVCNLNCPFCLQTSRKPRFMSLDEVAHVLREIDDQTEHLYLHLKGEPTLHPELKAIMDLAYDHHKKVHLVTNGTRLSALDFDLIAHPTLSSLAISLQCVQTLSDPERQTYLKNLENLIIRSESAPFSLFLRVWSENNEELLNWLRTVLKVDFQYHPSKHRIQIRKNLALDFDKEFQWPSLNNPFIGDIGHCYGGLKMMAILVDGTLSPCCLDNDGDIALGNLFETPFKTLVSSERYQRFVSEMASNHLCEPLCQHCTYHLKHKKIGLG